MLRMASRRRLNASGLNHQSSPVTCRSWAIVASHEDWSYSQGIVLGGVGGSETGPGAVAFHFRRKTEMINATSQRILHDIAGHINGMDHNPLKRFE